MNSVQLSAGTDLLAALARDAADAADAQRQADATLLNAAAATATGLALIGGVFGTLSVGTPEGVLAGSAFLLLLAMSGNEIHAAALLSFHQGPRPRSILAALVLVLACLLYAAHWLLR